MSQIPPNPVTVKIGCDSGALTAAMTELDDLVGGLLEASVDIPDAFREGLLGIEDRTKDLIDIGSYVGPTLPAGETRMLLQPSEFFNRLLAALRARDWDVGVFVDLHDSVSVGSAPSNEERTSGESQGPSGVCPPKPQGDCDA
jgi:hypothetical protein